MCPIFGDAQRKPELETTRAEETNEASFFDQSMIAMSPTGGVSNTAVRARTGATNTGPTSFRRAAFVYWFSLLMFACTYLTRSTSPVYAVALSTLCLGFATFVHFLVLCHPLAYCAKVDADVEHTPQRQPGLAKSRTDDAELGSTEEHLFMHACLAANLRTANVLLWSGRVSKEYAAFVVRYLWQLGALAHAKNPNRGTEPDPKGSAVAVFELARAAFPDFVSVDREGLWAEIMLAWARGGAETERTDGSRPGALHESIDP